MNNSTKQDKKVLMDRSRAEDLERKALFLEEILDVIEDKYLGHLMEKAENDEDISFPDAEKLMR